LFSGCHSIWISVPKGRRVDPAPANLKNLAVLALSAFSVHPSWPAIWGELNPRVDGNPKTIETLTPSRTPRASA
jgi:hypothetical protein